MLDFTCILTKQTISVGLNTFESYPPKMKQNILAHYYKETVQEVVQIMSSMMEKYDQMFNRLLETNVPQLKAVRRKIRYIFV